MTTLSQQKTLISAALFSAIVLMSLVLTPMDATGVPASGFGENLPYVFAVVGLTLSLVFNNSREFSLLLLLGLCYFALQHFVWPAQSDPLYRELLLVIISLLLPLNFALSDLLRERGVFSQHGITRLLLLGLQVCIVGLIVQLRFEPVGTLLNQPFLDTAIPAQLNLPDSVALVSLATAIWLAIRCFAHTSCLQNSTLFAFIATLFAIHYIDQPEAATLWFIISGGIILAGLVLNTYNLAYHDDLTGLPSRRALKQHLQMLDRRYSIAMLDIDHFKKINDTHGHDIGDQVLRMIASQLRRTPGARAYRYGGEEFALVFPGKDEDESMALLESLRARIDETPFLVRARIRPRRKPEKPRQRVHKKTLHVTASIGLAAKRPHLSVAEDVLKAADRALYRAKRGGRNQVIRQAAG